MCVCEKRCSVKDLIHSINNHLYCTTSLEVYLFIFIAEILKGRIKLCHYFKVALYLSLSFLYPLIYITKLQWLMYLTYFFCFLRIFQLWGGYGAHRRFISNLPDRVFFYDFSRSFAWQWVKIVTLVLPTGLKHARTSRTVRNNGPVFFYVRISNNSQRHVRRLILSRSSLNHAF